MATQKSRWNSAYRTTLIALLAGLAPACSVSDKPAQSPGKAIGGGWSAG